MTVTDASVDRRKQGCGHHPIYAMVIWRLDINSFY